MYKLVKFFFIIGVLFLLTSCWSQQDIDERAIVLAVGLDKAADNKVEITLQIVKITQASKGNDSKQSEKPIWVNSSKGNTVFEAIRNQLVKSNRKPFFGHIRMIVIGEELAKDGIIEVINFFERDHEIRLTPHILIAKGISAKSVLEAESELEDFPATHLESIIKNNTANAKLQNTTLIDVLKAMNRPGHDPAVGTIESLEIKKKLTIKDLEVKGAAILKEHKLVGFLSPIETRGFLFTQDKVKGTIINIPDPYEKDKEVAVEILRSRGKRDVILEQNKLKLVIDIKAVGNIGGQESSMDLSSSDTLSKLEVLTEKRIEKEIKDAINIAQKKYKSDFLAFSRIAHKKYPEYWKNIKSNWIEVFSSVPIDINVEVKIKRTGLITRPTSPK